MNFRIKYLNIIIIISYWYKIICKSKNSFIFYHFLQTTLCKW